MNVKPKKHLGQNFLTDNNIAQKIVNALTLDGYEAILEVGPGKGVLTQFLLKVENKLFKCVEIDTESVDFLKKNIGLSDEIIINKDFLKLNIKSIFPNKQLAIIGNFPYNISSSIVFNVIENRDVVAEMIGMFQKEVAERLVAKAGNKIYGILSVIAQAFYDIEIIINVSEKVFFPQPKVQSAVIMMRRKEEINTIKSDYLFFKNVVKTAFNQRRKMLRNSLSSFDINNKLQGSKILEMRPEQLTFEDFDNLCQKLK